MGGNITMIIRESEKKVHKMCRWTNAFPYFIKHPGFISKDKKHLDEYLKTWYGMKEDYEKNKDTGNFEYPMTTTYIPDSGHIAPVEYGIVFIDFVKNKIISCQGYTSIDKIHMVNIAIAWNKRDEDSWEDHLHAVRDLYNLGALSELKDHELNKEKSFDMIKAFNESPEPFLNKDIAQAAILIST